MFENARTYEEAVQQFKWNIPPTYNLAYGAVESRAASDDLALITVDESWREERYTFAQLSRWSNRFANRLAAGGLSAGDRVAVLLPGSLAAAVAHLAILKAGMISVPIMSKLDSNSIRARIQKVGARALITNHALEESHRKIWCDVEEPPTVYVLSDSARNSAKFIELVLSDAKDTFDIAPTKPSDPALIAFTSGSTAEPKGVLHAHQVVLGCLPGTIFAGRPAPGETIWSHFDWGWMGGLNIPLAAWHFGMPYLLHDAPAFDAEIALAVLRQFSVRHATVAPTVLRMWQLLQPEKAEFKLKSITTGGEKLGLETWEWVSNYFGLTLGEMYGMSECAGIIGSGHILEVRPGALGKAVPGQDVRIIDESGKELPRGDSGSIGVRSPHPAMFLCYWNEPQATRDRFIGEFLNTGDIGVQDEDGYFWYLYREDDMIKSGAHRISPAEIERAMSGHPAIEEAAAVGAPDLLGGQIVELWVQLKPGFSPTESTERSLRAHANANLAPQQRPRGIKFVERLPLTPTGKVNRAALRDQATSP